MGLRHKAREAALRLVYQLELTGDTSDAAVRTYWADLPPKLTAGRAYAEDLVATVRARSSEIDALIDGAATNWQLNRLARIDLSILRVAVGEMLTSRGVPDEVIIDEAVELARTYSDEQAPGFVNGVLDKIARDRAEHQKAGA